MHTHPFSFETVIYYNDLETDVRWQQTRELMRQSGVEAVTFYYIREHELRHQSLKVILPRIEQLGRCAEELRSHGLHTACALLPALSWGQVVEEGPFEKIVGADGTRSGAGSCPLDPNLREYLNQCAVAIADAGFDLFSLEDDFQTDNHRPVRGGCFCSRHLEGFSAVDNRTWTRETLGTEVQADPELKKRWDDYKRSVLIDLAEQLQESARGAHVCLLGGTDINAEPGQFIQRVETEYFRPSHGYYDDTRFAGVAGAWRGALPFVRKVKPLGVKGFAEITSWPRNAFTKSWTTMMLQTAVVAFFGFDGALFWAGHGPRDKGFARAVAGRRKWYDALHSAAATHPRLIGIGTEQLSGGALMLARMGIPMTFDREHAIANWGENILDQEAMLRAGMSLASAPFFACERMTTDPVNGSYADWPSTCLTQLQPDDFRYADPPDGARVLAEFLNNDSEVVAPSVVLDQAGERLLLSHSNNMWLKLIGDPKAHQLHHAIEQLIRKSLPAAVLGAPDVFVFVREDEKSSSRMVLLVNESNDAAVDWTLRTDGAPANVQLANEVGDWISCDVKSLTLPAHSATLLHLM